MNVSVKARRRQHQRISIQTHRHSAANEKCGIESTILPYSGMKHTPYRRNSRRRCRATRNLNFTGVLRRSSTIRISFHRPHRSDVFFFFLFAFGVFGSGDVGFRQYVNGTMWAELSDDDYVIAYRKLLSESVWINKIISKRNLHLFSSGRWSVRADPLPIVYEAQKERKNFSSTVFALRSVAAAQLRTNNVHVGAYPSFGRSRPTVAVRSTHSWRSIILLDPVHIWRLLAPIWLNNDNIEPSAKRAPFACGHSIGNKPMTAKSKLF